MMFLLLSGCIDDRRRVRTMRRRDGLDHERSRERARRPPCMRRSIAPRDSRAMRSKRLRFGKGFRVAFANRRGEAAELVIAPGDSEGGPGNAHRGADQWMLVVDGSGTAIVDGRRRALGKGTLLLIEKGEKHEIRNTGRRPLKSFVVYTPPAYTRSGARLPRGKP
jgi:mannose-6-phosphate isomerase-like protein (cupin superfamily)